MSTGVILTEEIFDSVAGSVVIPRLEYESLIENEAKIEMLRTYISTHDYISDDVVMAILGVEKKEKGK